MCRSYFSISAGGGLRGSGNPAGISRDAVPRQRRSRCPEPRLAQTHGFRQALRILSLSLSLIIAMNSELVGFPLVFCMVYPK